MFPDNPVQVSYKFPEQFKFAIKSSKSGQKKGIQRGQKVPKVSTRLTVNAYLDGPIYS